MACRLDDKHGPVNRSIFQLDANSVVKILSRSKFAANNAPKNERALLRIAVDWATQRFHAPTDINKVMGEIFFAGLPVYTLLYQDLNRHLFSGLIELAQNAELIVSRLSSNPIASFELILLGATLVPCPAWRHASPLCT